MKNRELLYDKMKGVGMLLLFWGHLFTYGSIFFSLIFAFHMPMFFFIAGLFVNPTDDHIYYFKKCFRRYILPYIFFWIVGFGIMIIKYTFGYGTLDYLGYLRNTLYSLSPYQGHVESIWFLPILATSLIITNFLLNICFVQSKIGKICVIIILSVLSIFMECIDIQIMRVTTIFTTTLFVFLGYLMRNHFIKIIQNHRAIVSLIFIIPLFVSLSLYNKTVNISIPQYNNYALYLICAIMGIYIVAVFANLSICKPLVFWGRNSLVIFCTHGISIAAYSFILGLVFDTSMYPMINIPNIWCLVGGGVVMLMSIPMYYIFNPAVKKITQAQ